MASTCKTTAMHPGDARGQKAADILYGRFPSSLPSYHEKKDWRQIQLDLEKLGLHNYFEEMDGFFGELFSGTESWGAAVPLLPEAWCELGERYYLEPENALSDTYQLQHQLILDTAAPDFTDYTATAQLAATLSDHHDEDPATPERLDVSISRMGLDGERQTYLKGQVEVQHLLAVEHLAMPILEGDREWVFFDMVAFSWDFRPYHGGGADFLAYMDAGGDMIGWVSVRSK